MAKRNVHVFFSAIKEGGDKNSIGQEGAMYIYIQPIDP